MTSEYRPDEVDVRRAEDLARSIRSQRSNLMTMLDPKGFFLHLANNGSVDSLGIRFMDLDGFPCWPALKKCRYRNKDRGRDRDRDRSEVYHFFGTSRSTDAKAGINYIQYERPFHSEWKRTLEDALRSDMFGLQIALCGVFQYTSSKLNLSPDLRFIEKSRHNMTGSKRKNADVDDYIRCNCTDGCDERCHNVHVRVICDERHCPCPSKCQNIPFHLRKTAKVYISPVHSKGLGMFAAETIMEGAYIDHYVGEIHDAGYLPPSSYVMRFDDHCIDSKDFGNMSRFINSSCEPNCETQKWTYKGLTHIGIFALRQIKKHEEITYDYGFKNYFQHAGFDCKCGSSKCKSSNGTEKEFDHDKTIEYETLEAAGYFAPKVRTCFECKQSNHTKHWRKHKYEGHWCNACATRAKRKSGEWAKVTKRTPLAALRDIQKNS